jgi:DNA-binding beta-propeller fold protein YncE
VKVRLALLCAALAAGVHTGRAAPKALPPLPGPQPDGFTLLHNQWLIRPAGKQVELGDFPVSLAVDRSGDYAAVLHAGYKKHELRIVDLRKQQTTAVAPLPETFYGLAFSPDGRTLVCSGGSDEILRVFAFDDGKLAAQPDVRVAPANDSGVVAGVAFAPDGRTAVASLLFNSKLVCVDLSMGRVRWTTPLGPASAQIPGHVHDIFTVLDNDGLDNSVLDEGAEPLAVVWDARRSRIYASLWGQSDVAVLDAADGRVITHWTAGLHPNELLLTSDGRRLFVSNGGRNTVTILDTATGQPVETLCSALTLDDPPGSTPDSLALTPDGRTLFAANAYNNNIAVFDVSAPGGSRPLGFIPTGWFPTSVRLTPNGRRLLVLSARGLEPKANSTGSATDRIHIGGLYHGALGIIDLPHNRAFDAALAAWTLTAQRCRPSPPPAPAETGNPIPERVGGPSPIRHVIYVIKENRTYDQVFGDISAGNGDPALCLFPDHVTPNLHALARDFVLLDNFYANAEISASGHEWSMGAYASEFVEKTWPVEYGHRGTKVPYPGEGFFAAAIPALGYLWDRAAAAGLTYRSYGEFVTAGRKPTDPGVTAMPALKGHFDPSYRPWDLSYHDVDRIARFVTALQNFEAAGDMPQLQILRLPQDHTSGARKGAWTPAAMVADNDLAAARLVAAVSHSKFWPDTAIFIVEDDAQSGPDHVDAHRTEALVVSPWCRRRVVDSTPYTTCSMLRTMELILGLEPMSQFDAAATPMRACFQAKPDLTPWTAYPAQVDIDARNPGGTAAAEASARFDFSHEDAVDDQAFNRVIWAVVRGPKSVMPAPVHAAFVRSVPAALADDDD